MRTGGAVASTLALLLAACLVGGCSAGATGAGATGAGATGAGATADPPEGCGSLLLIGVRGSGESSTADHGLGVAVGDLAARLTAANPGRVMATYGLPYAARTLSADTITDAAGRLATTVQRRHQRCPAERIVLAGYSLGAEIVGNMLQKTPEPRLASELTAAVLFSDPRFDPADTVTAAGTFDPRYHGDRRRPAFPPGLAGRIRSYCRHGDKICQFNDPLAQKAEHAHYPPEQTTQAMMFVESSVAATGADN
jgi:dienelactone hydrolase